MRLKKTMPQIKVKNFGAINAGCKETLDIQKVTIFSGDQSSGKSSVAKIFAVFSELEKNLAVGIIQERNAATNFMKYCNSYGLLYYFSPGTILEYQGTAYAFCFSYGGLTLSKRFSPDWYSPPGDTIIDILQEREWTYSQLAEYMGFTVEEVERLVYGALPITRQIAIKLEDVLGSSTQFWLDRESQYRDQQERIDTAGTLFKAPNIKYIPSERSLFSILSNAEKVRRLPQFLVNFWEQLTSAMQAMSSPLTLPGGKVQFEYDKNKGQGYVIGADYRVPLLIASSGIQALVPLLLVIETHENLRDALSAEDQNELQLQVRKILFDNSLAGEVQDAAIKVLSRRYRDDYCLAIIEDIEQNLTEDIQIQLFYRLLTLVNRNGDDSLLMTTHNHGIACECLSRAVKNNELKQEDIAVYHFVGGEITESFFIGV
jgi:plasmid maintenance system antidote protein VapI